MPRALSFYASSGAAGTGIGIGPAPGAPGIPGLIIPVIPSGILYVTGALRVFSNGLITRMTRSITTTNIATYFRTGNMILQ
jgi:hypothetical protein